MLGFICYKARDELKSEGRKKLEILSGQTAAGKPEYLPFRLFMMIKMFLRSLHLERSGRLKNRVIPIEEGSFNTQSV